MSLLWPINCNASVLGLVIAADNPQRGHYRRYFHNRLLLVLVEDMGVYLGGVDFFVAEQFLHRINIRSEVEHKHGKSVACTMGSEWLSKEEQTGEDKT